jgi:hypothetical protein
VWLCVMCCVSGAHQARLSHLPASFVRR